jgi:hypothetical protein
MTTRTRWDGSVTCTNVTWGEREQTNIVTCDKCSFQYRSPFAAAAIHAANVHEATEHGIGRYVDTQR